MTDSAASGGKAIKFGTSTAPFMLCVTEPNAFKTGVPKANVFALADIHTEDQVITVAGTIIDGKKSRRSDGASSQCHRP